MLGRAGLTSHSNGIVSQIRFGRASVIGDGHAHPGGVGVIGVVTDGASTEDLRFRTGQKGLVVRGNHPVQERGPVPGPPIGQGRRVGGQLNGGKHTLGLANGEHQRIRIIPAGPAGIVGVERFLALRIGAVPLLLEELHPGFLSQAQILGHRVNGRHSCADARLIEEIVAGHRQGLFHIENAMCLPVIGVDETLGGIALFLIFGVDAFVLNGGRRGNLPLVDGGNGHSHFEHRTGRVGRLESPVVQRVQLRLPQLIEILGIGGQMEGGITGAGQHLAGLHIDSHHRTPFGVLPLMLLSQALFPKLQDDLLQGSLRCNLHVEVNGGFHIGACLGLGLEILRHHIALGIHRGELHPIGTVEIFFEGSFKAALAHIGIHGVALILVGLPLLGIHQTQVSKDVGGIGSGIFPHRRGFHIEARGVQLQNGRQILRRHVLQEGIGRQVGEIAAQLQLIAQSHHQPHLPVRPIVGNSIGTAQLLHQLGRRNVGIPLPVIQKVLEISLPGGREL